MSCSNSEFRKIFNFLNLKESKSVLKLSGPDSYENTISAGGCLFYKIVDDQIFLLMISYNKKPALDDLGGKVDNVDSSIFETIARETYEETNHVIQAEHVMKIVKEKKYVSFYTKSAKYYIIVSEVDANFYIDTSIFGSYESHAKIGRTIKWFNYFDNKKNLAVRLLANKKFTKHFDDMQEQLNICRLSKLSLTANKSTECIIKTLAINFVDKVIADVCTVIVCSKPVETST